MRGLFFAPVFTFLISQTFAAQEDVSDREKNDVVDELFSVFWAWHNRETTTTDTEREWLTEKVGVLKNLKQTYGVKGLFAFLDHVREDFETLGRYGTYSWWMGSGESERNTARISEIKIFLQPYKGKAEEDLKAGGFLFDESKSPIARYILFYMSPLLTTEVFPALEYLERAIKETYTEEGWLCFKGKLDTGDEELLGIFSCPEAKLDGEISSFVSKFESYKKGKTISQFEIIAEEISNWIRPCKTETKAE